jgi:hypothetical protein
VLIYDLHRIKSIKVSHFFEIVYHEEGNNMEGWNDGGGMDWTDLAQDRDQWRDLVNTVVNTRVQ